MKTYITISVEERKQGEFTKKTNSHIHNTVDAALVLMEAGQQVQFKITNLPLRKEDK